METSSFAMEESEEKFRECIESCWECYRYCRECIRHCLFQKKFGNETTHIRVLLLCGQNCRTMAIFLTHKSKFSYEMSQLCARICTMCAELLNTTDDADEMMQLVADECFQCALSCKNVIPE